MRIEPVTPFQSGKTWLKRSLYLVKDIRLRRGEKLRWKSQPALLNHYDSCQIMFQDISASSAHTDHSRGDETPQRYYTQTNANIISTASKLCPPPRQEPQKDSKRSHRHKTRARIDQESTLGISTSVHSIQHMCIHGTGVARRIHCVGNDRTDKQASKKANRPIHFPEGKKSQTQIT